MMLSKTTCLLFAFLFSLIIATEAASVYQRRAHMSCSTNPGSAGLYPADPNDCSLYYYCTAGDSTPRIQKCHDDTLYSAILRRCVVPSRVDCASQWLYFF